MNKPHSNNTLTTLPLEDQQRLLDWHASHTLHEILHLAAQPRPDGLGLKSSLSTLSRFFTHVTKEDIIQAQLETLALAQSIAQAGQGITSHLQPALLQTLEEKALRELLDPNQSLTGQSKLANTIIRLAAIHQQARKIVQKDQVIELHRQARQLAAQRHDLKLLETMRDHFPMVHRVNWEAETQDAHSIERLKRLFNLVPHDTNLGEHTRPRVSPSAPPPTDSTQESTFVPDVALGVSPNFRSPGIASVPDAVLGVPPNTLPLDSQPPPEAVHGQTPDPKLTELIIKTLLESGCHPDDIQHLLRLQKENEAAPTVEQDQAFTPQPPGAVSTSSPDVIKSG